MSSAIQIRQTKRQQVASKKIEPQISPDYQALYFLYNVPVIFCITEWLSTVVMKVHIVGLDST